MGMDIIVRYTVLVGVMYVVLTAAKKCTTSPVVLKLNIFYFNLTNYPSIIHISNLAYCMCKTNEA
jgi:hypothetical protein